jgi:soluble lytic murein transglycosylase-like protein
MPLDFVNAIPSGHDGVDQWNSLWNQIPPQFGVPPNLAKAFCLYESGGNASAMNLRDGGSGLMQITYNVVHPNGYATPPHLYQGQDVMDPSYNVMVSCRDFIKPSINTFGDNLDAIIASYNAGPGRVQDALNAGTDLTTITFKPWYIPSVRNAYEWFVKEARASG